jgi:zinc transport system substrate-binding protein
MLHNKKGAIFALTAFSVTASLTLPAQANVVASLKPVGFIAAAIADGVTPVDVLLPDGASEHDYSLRPSDAKRLKNADLVVWVGPEMEAFMAKSAAELPAQKNLAMVNIDGVKPLLISGGEDEDEHTAEKSEEQEADAHHHHHGAQDRGCNPWKIIGTYAAR